MKVSLVSDGIFTRWPLVIAWAPGAGCAARARSDGGAFAAAGDGANNGPYRRGAADNFGGLLAARVANPRDGLGVNGHIPIVDLHRRSARAPARCAR